MPELLKIWTDGSCFPNPGAGGWAWICQDGRQGSGRREPTTNQRMELLAAIEGIRSNLSRPGQIVVISDSQYVVRGATLWYKGWLSNGWRNSQGKPVANVDLWKELLALKEAAAFVDFQWVRGHNGDEMNEKADRLANSMLNAQAENEEVQC